MKTCKLYLSHAGYCTSKASHAVKGDPGAEIQFGALFGLIEHPEKGWILFDTGYTNRFFEATRKYPNKLYAKITKVYLKPEEEASEFIQSFGLSADDIKHVIISHFHGDHISGLREYNNATFYCSKPAYKQVKQVSDFFAVTKGILKELLPADFEQRLQFIEDIAVKSEDECFGKSYDLFGDNLITLFSLPGHAAGQMGLQLTTEKRKYFLVADACWDLRAITENKLPNPIVRLFFDSWSDYKESIYKLQAFHKRFPEVVLVPTHCARSTKPLLSTKNQLNAL
jgi:glyoxylase-like metal-dependent hydrolase (beta-lactamase superfamily II)